MGFWLRKTPQSPVTLSGTYPDAYYGQAYSHSLTITGGTLPYTPSLVSGALPDGLTLQVAGDQLTLSGTPTNGGTAAGFTFGVKVTDAVATDSNTVNTSGMIVNMWSSPTYSAKWGKDSRVSYAATTCGYLGTADTTTAFTSAVTIASGNGSGHFQLQNRTMGSGTSSGGNTLVKQEVGLAPAGTGAGNNDWGDVWPTSGSASDLYTITLEHTATGQQCVVTVDTDFTYTWQGRTYSSSNCVSIATTYECRNPQSGATAATNYIVRNASEGGLILVRDGCHIGGEFPTYAHNWIGSSTYASGSVAFSRGTWSADDATFLSIHGDMDGTRVVNGWEGGNYTLVIPETPFGATISNLQPAAQGMIFAHMRFETSAQSAGLFPRADDAVADSCYFTKAEGVTLGQNVRGLRAQTVNPYPRYMTAVNCMFDDLDDAIVGWFVEPYSGGNLFTNLVADAHAYTIDPSSSSFPVGGTCTGYVTRNVCINSQYMSGAHKDFVQYRVLGSTGSLPGTFVIEKNIVTAWEFQGSFNGGGSATAAKINCIDRLNAYMTAALPNQHTYIAQQNYESYCNTVLWNYNSPNYVPGNTPGWVLFSPNSCVNVTIEDNVSHRYDTPQATGTVTFGSTSNLVPGDNALMTTSDTVYEDRFVSYLGPGGDMAAITADIVTYQDAWDVSKPYFTPLDANAAAGGLKRADGSGPGVFTPAGGWNDGVTAW